MSHKERSRIQAESSDNNVKVCVRVRPSKPGELVIKRCISVSAAANAIILDTKPESKVFSYDYVADEFVTQAEIFNMAGKQITDACMSGYNATIFAYGQTGSGKTWTIQGGTDENGDIINEQRGLIPRIFEYLFQLLKEDTEATYTCKCSFLEIYNEQITDLLSPSSTNLSIHENLGRGGYVEGLKEEVVQTAQGAYNVLMAGISNRHVGYTAMNSASSRSHSVFTLSLESRSKSADGLTHVKNSRLNLIDLAGSERQKSTDAVGLRLKEAGNINKSLSALGNVIRALVDVADGKPRHVHYRDSKLTYLLKDSLGGNSKTCIIATVSPADSCFGESLSTLKFAQRAKLIKNMAVVNENSAGSVMALQAEVRRLREELASANGGHPSSGIAPVHSSGKVGRLMELEVLLSKAIDDTEELREDKSKLEYRIGQLKVLCERKDNYMMNTKMVVRLRESQLAKLEMAHSRGELAEDLIPPRSADEDELRDEVRALRSIVDLHPEVTRFAMENLELRDDIAKLDSMSDADAQIADLKNHIHDLSNQLNVVLKEKHDLMKGDSDQEKTETIMALRMKLDTQTMEMTEKNEYISFLTSEVERAKSELIATEQMYHQAVKEMAQKEKDIQDMMTLADEAFQQKNGSSEKLWAAQIQKLQEEFREKDAARHADVVQRDETIAKLRLELAQTQVANRRLSSHFAMPEDEDDDLDIVLGAADQEADVLFPCSPARPAFSHSRSSFSGREQQMHDLQSKLDALTEEIAQLREERDTFADEIKFLRDREQEQKDVQMATGDVTTSNSDEVQMLKARIEELITENQDYNRMMDKYSELQSQAFQYHIERDEMEEAHKVRVGQIESELRRCKTELTEKEAQLSDREALLVSKADLQEHPSQEQQGLEEECANLRARLAEEEQRATELAFVREESVRLQSVLASKEDEIATVKSQMESLVLEHRSKHDDFITQLDEKEKTFHEQTQGTQAKIAALEQECLVLREEIETANELDLSNMYERQLKKARQENENLQAKVREAEEYKDRALGAEKQLQGSSEELQSLKCALSELEVQKETSIREAQQLNQMLEEQLQVSKEDIQRARGELAASVERTDSIKQQLDASLGEVQAYQCTVRRLEEEVQRYQEEANETNRLGQETSLRLSELTHENETLKVQMAATKKVLQDLEESMAQLRSNAKGHADEEQVNQLQQKLSTADSELMALQSNLDATLIRLETTERQLKDSEAGALFLQSEKEALVDTHASELQELTETKEALLVRATTAEKSVEALSAQLKDEAKKYADLLGHHNPNQKIRHTNQLKSEIAKLQDENQRLKQKVTDTTKQKQIESVSLNKLSSVYSPSLPRNSVLQNKGNTWNGNDSALNTSKCNTWNGNDSALNTSACLNASFEVDDEKQMNMHFSLAQQMDKLRDLVSNKENTPSSEK